MRLLICTQAVDLDDPVLGFFHRWIEEFSARFARIRVICLKEGRHTLSSEVSVHSLGKELGRSRFKYILRFFHHAWSLRNDYDAVFVHMNQEYVLLAGVFWKLMGKKVVLWRNHQQGDIFTRVACMLVDAVCHTSPEAFVANHTRAHQMPVGIDTTIFAPGKSQRNTILFLGRLDPIKKPEVFLEAMQIVLQKHPEARADVYGSPSPSHLGFANDLQNEFSHPCIVFHGAVTNEEAPAIYRSHSLFVNLTPSGSFDKTIIEALASGCIVVAANAVVRDVLGNRFVTDPTAGSVAAAIGRALELSSADQVEAHRIGREYAEQHSLKQLVERIEELVAS